MKKIILLSVSLLIVALNYGQFKILTYGPDVIKKEKWNLSSKTTFQGILNIIPKLKGGACFIDTYESSIYGKLEYKKKVYSYTFNASGLLTLSREYESVIYFFLDGSTKYSKYILPQESY